MKQTICHYGSPQSSLALEMLVLLYLSEKPVILEQMCYLFSKFIVQSYVSVDIGEFSR